MDDEDSNIKLGSNEEIEEELRTTAYTEGVIVVEHVKVEDVQ